MSPFISVVIPTLNEENFLPHLLTDLSGQKEKDFETIVVDGKSDDNTCKVCDDYGNLAITILTSTKRNVSIQRNMGAAQAKGKYIVFLDADSRIKLNFVSKLKSILKKNKYLIIIPTVVADCDTPTEQVYIKLINYVVELSQYTHKPFCNGGHFVFERYFFYHLGGFNKKLYLSEDHEIIQRAKKIGVKAKYTHNLSLKVSLRRFQKDGTFNILGKYSLAFFYALAKGGVDKKLFDYEMGGARYSKEDYKQKLIKFKSLYKQLFGSVDDLM